jgi:hypothetical protein
MAGFKSFTSYALTSSAGGLHFLKNNGDLTFTPTTLTGANCTDCKFVDVDGDTDLDIVALGINAIYSFLNNGTGTYSAGPTTTIPNPVGTGNSTSEMAFGFIDGNSVPDMVWASGNVQSTGQAYAALGTGTGAFTQTATQTTGMGGSFSGVNSITMLKVNADSVWDAVAGPAYVGGSSTQVHLRTSLMGGGGTFGSWTASGGTIMIWGGISSIRPGNFMNAAGPCIVITSTQDPPDSGGVGGSQLNVYSGTTALSTQTNRSIPAGLTKSVGVGDFDFDGIDDFAISAKVAVTGTVNPPTGGTPGLVYVYKGSTATQSVTLNLATGTPTVTLAQSGRVCAGDVDGDGRPDLLCTTSFWATDNQQSTTWQRGDSCDGNPMGIVFYLNSSN